MSDFLVITGQGASLGFQTAGVETLEVDGSTDVSALLLDLQEQASYGLIAIEEAFLDKVSANVMKRLRKRGLPVIIPIKLPQMWGEAEAGESPVLRLIRRAIGYQIKLKR
jgi:V/A-type H+-transporting ATPase subunit F